MKIGLKLFVTVSIYWLLLFEVWGFAVLQCQGRAIVREVITRSVTALLFQSSLCAICDESSGTATAKRSYPTPSALPCQYRSTNALNLHGLFFQPWTPSILTNSSLIFSTYISQFFASKEQSVYKIARLG